MTDYYVGVSVSDESKAFVDESGDTKYRCVYDMAKFVDFDPAKAMFLILLSGFTDEVMSSPEVYTPGTLSLLAMDGIRAVADMKPESFTEDQPVWLVDIDGRIFVVICTRLPDKDNSEDGNVPEYRIVADHSNCTEDKCMCDDNSA